MTPLLRFENVTVHYGAIRALHDLSFDVEAGQIVTLIGSNGAGKSTTLRAASGLARPSSGRVLLRGESIAELPAHEIVRKRISHAPEGRGIFHGLSVAENLDLGAWAAPSDASGDADLEHVLGLFPRLRERYRQSAGTLSGGEQQMLTIARALMARPEILFLDEPSLGLAPQLIEKIFEIIQAINRQGKTIVLVEQNARQALLIAHRGVVLETGRAVLQGAAKSLLEADEVRRAYLGG